MNGLDSYVDAGEESQKQTHITIPNPDHPDSSVSEESVERIREHFRAANTVKDSAVNRKFLVGDFLVAIESIIRDDDPSDLEEMVEEILEEDE